MVSIIFSFRNVQGTKVIQYFIICVRFLAIFLMVFGAIFLIAKKNHSDDSYEHFSTEYDVFYYPGFESFFSTGVFALLMHHSIPSILKV